MDATNFKITENHTRGLRQPDPIMQTLWAVKAQINKECDYSIDKVFEMARDSRLARLKKNENDIFVS
jgi:hypothetical protein